MPVPTDLDDLSTTAASNSPSGSDQRSTADDYLRAHGRMIALLRDRTSGVVNVKDFGAVCDGSTDDTTAWQAAISWVAGTDVPNRITMPVGSTSVIEGTVYLAPHVTIDLAGGWLEGDGTNTMFETGYWSGGSLVTNHGQANEAHIVDQCRVMNGEIRNCDIAFNLFNFCEGSVISNIRMSQVNQAIFAHRCFYGTFENVLSRSPLDDSAYPCFHFHDEVNDIVHNGLRAVGYDIGHKLSGTKRGLVVINGSAESCIDGIVVENTTYNLAIHGWYFETITGTAIEFDSGGNHDNVFIDGCWFDAITTAAISGSTISSGQWGSNNRLGNGTLSLNTNFANRLKVSIPTDVASDNTTTVSIPSAYSLGDANVVDYVKHLYDSGAGTVLVKGRMHGGVIPVAYSGDVGAAKNTTVPFCTLNVAATTVTIDTSIRYRDGMMGGWSLVITDGGTLVITGFFIGTTKVDVAAAGKTVTLSNNSGFLRIAVTGLSAASACTGYVRLFQ